MDESQGHRVALHVYDLSRGLAKQFSISFIGKQIEGIWHTGIICYGKEYYWGGVVQEDYPGQTPYGIPTKTIELGYTHVPFDIFKDFIISISPNYTIESYRLLSNNCNNFSNEVSQFLLGTTIPSDIVNLPTDALDTPMGAMLKPFILQMESAMKQQVYGHTPLFAEEQSNNFPSVGNLSNVLPAPFPLPSQTNVPLNFPTAPTATVNSNNNNSSNPLPSAKEISLKHIKSDGKPLISNQGSVNVVINKLRKFYGDDVQIGQLLNALETYASGVSDVLPDGTFSLFEKYINGISSVDASNSAVIFSHLFLFRLLILRQPFLLYFISKGQSVLLAIFQKFINAEGVTPTVQAMALTVASNLFSTHEGVEFMTSDDVYGEVAIEKVTQALLSTQQDTVRQPAAAVLYNYSLFLSKDGNDKSIQVLTSVVELLSKETLESLDAETANRLLLCLGHLLLSNNVVISLFKDLLPNFKSTVATKLISKFKSTLITELCQDILTLSQ